MKPPTNKLSLHKFKNYGAFDSLDPTSKGYRLEYVDDLTKLFIQVKEGKPPGWVSYLGTLISNSKDELHNKTCSFILLRKHGDAAYAVTGGYAYNEVREFAVEDFGIQVAMRMVDNENSIATIGQRSLKGSTRHLLRTVAGYDPSLDRENYNRMLQALEGKASFEGRRFIIKGRETLTLRTSRGISELDSVIADVEDALAQEPRITFPRSYAEINDPSEIALLEESLAADFSSFWRGLESRDDIYLELKDPLAQFRCDEFEVRWDGKCFVSSDFDLGRIRDGLVEKGAAVPASFDDLVKIRVRGLNESGHVEFGPETFASMLVYESSLDDGISRIRIGGKWFRILDELQHFLNEQISDLVVYRNLLPDWDRKEYVTEKKYNEEVANILRGVCLDQDLILLKGGSRIEVCDIFQPENRRFIHVKETWGAKAAYLFAQGLVSAEFYGNDADFRNKCALKWPLIFADRIEDAEIIFAIANGNACEGEFPLNLSYFAKVSLYDACVRLRALGYKVALTGVNIVR